MKMIQLHFLSVQILWMMFTKILIITTQKDRKVLIVFDDMIADIMTNNKFKAIIKELFIRCKKSNISLAFLTQSYFSVPKDAKLNSTHYLIMKINNRRKLESIAINHSAEIYRECTKEP